MLSELYLIRSPYTFLGIDGDPSRSPVSIVGVPFDSTNSFRGGSRFAPSRIRLVSQSLETYSFRCGTDLELQPPYDEGDVAVSHGDAGITLKNVAVVSSDLLGKRRIPIFMGGDHIITYGVINGVTQSLGRAPCVVVFDAHLDLRPEYLGYRWSHACTTRRLTEIIGSNNVLVVGARAASKKEIEDARKLGIKYITSLDLMRKSVREVTNKVKDLTNHCTEIYFSIDMDVIDPAYAPGVATPEPEGITPTQLLDILWRLTDERTIGADIVEVNPLVDTSDTTSFLAAKILIELISFIQAKKTITPT